jgi:uncharacterized delta-60 repeat protein
MSAAAVQYVNLRQCILTALLCVGLGKGLEVSTTAAAGDVDQDGRVTAADAALALRFAERIQLPDSEQKGAADADGDGMITRRDAEWILNWSARELTPGSAWSSFDVDELAILAESNAILASEGGNLRLASGVELRVAPGRLARSESVILRKLDDQPLDPVEHCDYYSVQSATLSQGGFSLTVPANDLSGGRLPEEIEDVAVAVYHPAARVYALETVEWRTSESAIDIVVPSQIQAASIRTSGLETQSVGTSAPTTKPLIVVLFNRLRESIESQKQKTVLEVPFYQQGSYGYCWAASTTMGINFCLPADDSLKPLVKPWELADYFDIGAQDGLGYYDFYALPSYRNFLESRTGVKPERSIWPLHTSLRRYVRQQIEAGRPVVVFWPQFGHVVVMVGYETAGTKHYFYFHDPAGDSLYHKADWDRLLAVSGPFRRLTSTMVLPSGATRKPMITVSILGHEDYGTSGLVFVSPMMRLASFNGVSVPTENRANIRFSWFNPATTRYGFVANNAITESSPFLTKIPNYYGMDLALAIANASMSSVELGIHWELAPRGHTGPVVSGNQSHALAPQKTSYVPLRVEDLKSCSGSYSLWVEIHNIHDTSEIYDQLKLDVEFGPGIALSRGQSPSGVRLVWTRPDGDFDRFKIWRRRSADLYWTQVADIPAVNQSEYTDLTSVSETMTLYYAVTANQGRLDILFSSDILIVEPPSKPKPGSLDLSFQPGNGLSELGYVRAIAYETLGQVLIGGKFKEINGVPRTNLARLNPDGGVDQTFNSGNMERTPDDESLGMNEVLDLLALDDRIVVAGDFTLLDDTPRDRIALLLPNGRIDPSFNAGKLGTPGISRNASVRTLARQGQAILIGGDFISIRDFYKNSFARLGADGTADKSFNTNQWPGLAVNAIVQQPDGRILVGGEFTGLSGNPVVRMPGLARFLPDGSWDGSFDTGGVYDWTSESNKRGGVVYRIALQPDGLILISGSFKGIGASLVTNMARLFPDGRVDASFIPPTLVASGSRGRVFALAVQSNGKILIGGNFDKINGILHSGWSRLNPDGSVDTGFAVVLGSVNAIELQPDGKILVGGDFEFVNNGTAWIRQRGIARLHGD